MYPVRSYDTCRVICALRALSLSDQSESFLHAPQAEPGSKVQFGRVLAHKANGSFVAGQPYLENVRVEAEILEELKGPKLIVRCPSLLKIEHEVIMHTVGG